jgi:hypothetical protein
MNVYFSSDLRYHTDDLTKSIVTFAKNDDGKFAMKELNLKILSGKNIVSK